MVLKRDPLGTEDSSDRSPFAPLVILARGSLGEATKGTPRSQLEVGGVKRQGFHPGGDDPAAAQQTVGTENRGP